MSVYIADVCKDSFVKAQVFKWFSHPIEFQQIVDSYQGYIVLNKISLQVFFDCLLTMKRHEIGHFRICDQVFGALYVLVSKMKPIIKDALINVEN